MHTHYTLHYTRMYVVVRVDHPQPLLLAFHAPFSRFSPHDLFAIHSICPVQQKSISVMASRKGVRYMLELKFSGEEEREAPTDKCPSTAEPCRLHAGQQHTHERCQI